MLRFIHTIRFGVLFILLLPITSHSGVMVIRRPPRQPLW